MMRFGAVPLGAMIVASPASAQLVTSPPTFLPIIDSGTTDCTLTGMCGPISDNGGGIVIFDPTHSGGGGVVIVGTGVDTVEANTGSNTVIAGSGHDTIDWSGGAPIIDTGSGAYDPTIVFPGGGSGTNTMPGASGSDYLPSAGDSSAPLPEPTSWAMMIAGFGLTGAAMRRRRARSGAAPEQG